MPVGRPKGSKIQNSIKRNAPLKNTKPEINIATKEDKQILIAKPYKCTRCGVRHSKLKGNFSASQSPLYVGNNEGSIGYLPICKKCLDELFNHYTIVLGDEKEAVRRMCIKFDIYFNESAYESSRKISADRSRITGYISKVNISPHTGKTYDDTIDEERKTKIDTIEDFDDLKESKSTKITQRVIKFFGLGFEESDYEWLNCQYQDWIARHECKTKAQEELFKNLSLIQLQIQKATQKGDKIEPLMNSFNTLLGGANIKPAQTNENALAEQNTFGTLIKIWENERPIPKADAEWEDVDGIGKYIRVWFLGHLCKMMGIKNTFSKEYENEISKYEIEKPEYFEDEEIDFKKVFGDVIDD